MNEQEQGKESAVTTRVHVYLKKAGYRDSVKRFTFDWTIGFTYIVSHLSVTLK